MLIRGEGQGSSAEGGHPTSLSPSLNKVGTVSLLWIREDHEPKSPLRNDISAATIPSWKETTMIVQTNAGLRTYRRTQPTEHIVALAFEAVLFLPLLFGCGGQARVQAIDKPPAVERMRELAATVHLRVERSRQVPDFLHTAADLPSEVFRDALEDSIIRSGLFGKVAQAGEADCELRTQIAYLEYDGTDASMLARWTLVRGAEVLVQAAVVTSCSKVVSFGSPPYAAAKFYECVGRENIDEGLRRLSARTSDPEVHVSFSERISADRRSVFADLSGELRLQIMTAHLRRSASKIDPAAPYSLELVVDKFHMRSDTSVSLLSFASGVDLMEVVVRVLNDGRVVREYRTGAGTASRSSPTSRMGGLIRAVAERVVAGL